MTLQIFIYHIEDINALDYLCMLVHQELQDNSVEQSHPAAKGYEDMRKLIWKIHDKLCYFYTHQYQEGIYIQLNKKEIFTLDEIMIMSAGNWGLGEPDDPLYKLVREIHAITSEAMRKPPVIDA